MARKHAWMFFLEIICSFRETDAKSDTREKLRVEEQVKSEEKISVPIFEPNVLIVLHVFSHSSLWMSKLSNVKMPILLASKMFSIFFKTLSSSQFGKKKHNVRTYLENSNSGRTIRYHMGTSSDILTLGCIT